jgi:hypothetical protein
MTGAEAAEAALKDRQHKLRKVQREADEAQRVPARLRVETAERLKMQEEDLSSYASDDSAVSGSSHQPGSQQEGNLPASDDLEVEVDTKEDSPLPSTHRSSRAKAPSRKIQSQRRRDQSQQR